MRGGPGDHSLGTAPCCRCPRLGLRARGSVARLLAWSTGRSPRGARHKDTFRREARNGSFIVTVTSSSNSSTSGVFHAGHPGAHRRRQAPRTAPRSARPHGAAPRLSPAPGGRGADTCRAPAPPGSLAPGPRGGPAPPPRPRAAPRAPAVYQRARRRGGSAAGGGGGAAPCRAPSW